MAISADVFWQMRFGGVKRKRTEGEPPPSVRRNRSMNERQDNRRIWIVNTGVKRKYGARCKRQIHDCITELTNCSTCARDLR